MEKRSTESGQEEALLVPIIVGFIWLFISGLGSVDRAYTDYVVDTGKKTVVERSYERECSFLVKFWKDPCEDEKLVSEYTYEYDRSRDLPKDVHDRVGRVLGRPDGVYPVE